MPKIIIMRLRSLFILLTLASSPLLAPRSAAADIAPKPPLTLSVSSNNVLMLTWSAVPGTSYFPMSVRSAEDRIWKPLADLYWIEAKDSTVTLSVPAPSGSQQFIRVIHPMVGTGFLGQIPSGKDNLTFYAGDFYYAGGNFGDDSLPQPVEWYGQFPQTMRRSLRDLQMSLREASSSNLFQTATGATLQKIEDSDPPLWRILNNEGPGAATNQVRVYGSLLSDPRVEYLQPVYYTEQDQWEIRLVRRKMYLELRPGVLVEEATEELRSLGVKQPLAVPNLPDIYIADYELPPRFEILKLSRAVSVLPTIMVAAPEMEIKRVGIINPE